MKSEFAPISTSSNRALEISTVNNLKHYIMGKDKQEAVITAFGCLTNNKAMIRSYSFAHVDFYSSSSRRWSLSDELGPMPNYCSRYFIVNILHNHIFRTNTSNTFKVINYFQLSKEQKWTETFPHAVCSKWRFPINKHWTAFAGVGWFMVLHSHDSPMCDKQNAKGLFYMLVKNHN